jgi:hypothetical protein
LDEYLAHFTYPHDLGDDDAMEGVGDGGVDADEVKVDGAVGDAPDSSLAD